MMKAPDERLRRDGAGERLAARRLARQRRGARRDRADVFEIAGGKIARRRRLAHRARGRQGRALATPDEVGRGRARPARKSAPAAEGVRDLIAMNFALTRSRTSCARRRARSSPSARRRRRCAPRWRRELGCDADVVAADRRPSSAGRRSRFPRRTAASGSARSSSCALLEEMGAALLCAPFFSTVCLGANALLAAGSEAQKDEWLPAIAAGERDRDGRVRRRPNGAGTPAIERRRASGGDFVLARPRRRSCSTGTRADARRGRGAREGSGEAASPLRACPATRRGSSGARSRRWTARGGSRARARRRARAGVGRGSAAEGAAAGTRSSDARPRAHRARGRAGRRRAALPRPRRRVREGARAVRASDRLASRRSSTGAPSMMVQRRVRALRQLVGGVRRGSGDAVETRARRLARESVVLRRVLPLRRRELQVHGGVGFTWEHDVHLYLKRARAERDAARRREPWHRERVARRIGLWRMTEHARLRRARSSIVTGGGERRRARHQRALPRRPAREVVVCGRNEPDALPRRRRRPRRLRRVPTSATPSRSARVIDEVVEALRTPRRAREQRGRRRRPRTPPPRRRASRQSIIAPQSDSRRSTSPSARTR